MSDTTRAMTIEGAAMLHGSLGVIPADDPIYKNGWTVGATVPYRQRAVTRAPSPGTTIPENNRTKEN